MQFIWALMRGNRLLRRRAEEDVTPSPAPGRVRGFRRLRLMENPSDPCSGRCHQGPATEIADLRQGPSALRGTPNRLADNKRSPFLLLNRSASPRGLFPGLQEDLGANSLPASLIELRDPEAACYRAAAHLTTLFLRP